MYENYKWSLGTIIKIILLMIFVFFILPWLFSLGDSHTTQQREPYENYDGAWPH